MKCIEFVIAMGAPDESAHLLGEGMPQRQGAVHHAHSRNTAMMVPYAYAPIKGNIMPYVGYQQGLLIQNSY